MRKVTTEQLRHPWWGGLLSISPPCGKSTLETKSDETSLDVGEAQVTWVSCLHLQKGSWIRLKTIDILPKGKERRTSGHWQVSIFLEKRRHSTRGNHMSKIRKHENSQCDKSEASVEIGPRRRGLPSFSSAIFSLVHRYLWTFFWAVSSLLWPMILLKDCRVCQGLMPDIKTPICPRKPFGS